MTETDPLAEARAIMQRQTRDAGSHVTYRKHNHLPGAACGSSCPAPGTDWDGRGMVTDLFVTGPATVTAMGTASTTGTSRLTDWDRFLIARAREMAACRLESAAERALARETLRQMADLAGRLDEGWLGDLAGRLDAG